MAISIEDLKKKPQYQDIDRLSPHYDFKEIKEECMLESDTTKQFEDCFYYSMREIITTARWFVRNIDSDLDGWWSGDLDGTDRERLAEFYKDYRRTIYDI